MLTVTHWMINWWLYFMLASGGANQAIGQGAVAGGMSVVSCVEITWDAAGNASSVVVPDAACSAQPKPALEW